MTDNKRKITVSFGIEGRLNEDREFSENVFIKLNTAFRNKQLQELKGAPLSVFMCLALHMDQKGECWPSNNLIEKETGYKEDAILKAKQKLEEEGYIHRRQERWTKDLIKKRFPHNAKQKIEEMKGKLGTWAPPTYTLFPPEEENETEKLSTGEKLSTEKLSTALHPDGKSTDPEKTENGENAEMAGSSPFPVLTGTVKDRTGFEPDRFKPGTKKNHSFEVEPEENNNKNHDRDQEDSSNFQKKKATSKNKHSVVVTPPPAKKPKKPNQIKKLLADAKIKIPDEVLDPLLQEKEEDTVTLWIQFITSNPEKVKNPGGFLRMALDKDWPLPSDFQHDRKRREKRKKQKQRAEQMQKDTMDRLNSWLSQQNVPELCRRADQYAKNLPRVGCKREAMRVFYIWDQFTRKSDAIPIGDKLEDALGHYAEIGRNMIKAFIKKDAT